MPADRPLSCRERDRLDGAGDAISLFGLAHPRMAFPSPAVGGDLVTTRDGVASKFGRALDGAAAGADCRLRAMRVEGVHHPPPPGARAIFKVAVEAEIGHALDAMRDLVDRFIRGIALTDGELRALLEIDDEGHGDPRVAGPARLRELAPIAEKVPAGAEAHRLRLAPGEAMRGKRGGGVSTTSSVFALSP